MSKIYGLQGAMTGKLANTVMVVRNGVQIARKYQPVVSNPNTAAQIEARAKLKLMSQLSAVMAPFIAMPRVGAVSSRNLFVKKNYPLATYSSNTANIELDNVQLTKSVLGISPIIVSREGSDFSIGLTSTQGNAQLSRVVYVAFVKQEDGKLRFYESSVVTEPGEGLRFGTTMPIIASPVVIYAYGVRDNTEAARAKFGDMQVLSAEQVAKLVVTSQLLEGDITLTETTGVTSNPA